MNRARGCEFASHQPHLTRRPLAEPPFRQFTQTSGQGLGLWAFQFVDSRDRHVPGEWLVRSRFAERAARGRDSTLQLGQLLRIIPHSHPQDTWMARSGKAADALGAQLQSRNPGARVAQGFAQFRYAVCFNVAKKLQSEMKLIALRPPQRFFRQPSAQGVLHPFDLVLHPFWNRYGNKRANNSGFVGHGFDGREGARHQPVTTTPRRADHFSSNADPVHGNGSPRAAFSN